MFWCSCCWLSWKLRDCSGRTFFIRLWWSIESFGISPVKLQTNAFSIFMHTCAYIVMILSEERLFAERLLASLSPWEIRPEVLFPPSTSLEWQTAFQAVREASTSPKISDNEKGKRRADWHHPGGSEYREQRNTDCGLLWKNHTSTTIHLPGFLCQVCFFSKLFYHLPWPVRLYINHHASGKRFCCPHWSSCKGL